MEDRDKLIKELYDSGATQQKISEKLGITRQRVQQLEKKLFLEGVLEKRRDLRRLIYCEKCGREILTKKEVVKFCSRRCFFDSKKLTPEQLQKKIARRKELNRIRANRFYHEVLKQRPDWREIIKLRNLKNKKNG